MCPRYFSSLDVSPALTDEREDAAKVLSKPGYLACHGPASIRPGYRRAPSRLRLADSIKPSWIGKSGPVNPDMTHQVLFGTAKQNKMAVGAIVL